METIQVAPPEREEVRIKIVSSGVCHSDLYFLRGGAGSTNFPVILGHEGAGIVESIGPEVTSVAPGNFRSISSDFRLIKPTDWFLSRWSRDPSLVSSM